MKQLVPRLCQSFSDGGRRGTAVVMVGAALAVLLDVSRPAALPQEQDPVATARVKEVRALVRAVYAVLRGRLVPSERPFDWSNDFFKGQAGNTYVPFTLTIERATIPASTVAMYVLVTPRHAPAADRTELLRELEDIQDPPPPNIAFEAAYFIDLNTKQAADVYRVRRAFSLAPGDYDVYVALAASSATEAPAPDPLTPTFSTARGAPPPLAPLLDSQTRSSRQPQALSPGTGERGTKTGGEDAKVMMIKQGLSVPDLWTTELSTSTVVVAERVEPLQAPLPPEQQISNPYTLGTARIVPNDDTDFQKTDLLSVIFFVYNPGLSSERKPDITVEYSFYHRGAGGERYFSKTDPQNFNAQTLPGFDVDAGHQLVAGQSMPLRMFPEGAYRLEIKVTDNTRGSTVTRNVDFAVR